MIDQVKIMIPTVVEINQAEADLFLEFHVIETVLVTVKVDHAQAQVVLHQDLATAIETDTDQVQVVNQF